MKRRVLVLNVACALVHLSLGCYAFADDRPAPALLWHDGPTIVQMQGVIALVTSAVHAGVYLPLYLWYADVVWFVERSLWVRWLEYSITSTLMTTSSAVNNGVDDPLYVVTLLLCGAVLQGIGYVLEQRTEVWKPLLLLGILVNAAAGVPIVWYTIVNDRVSDWFATLSFVFYYTGFAYNASLHATGTPFARVDWNYNVLSLTSKVAIFFLYVGGEGTTSWAIVETYGFGVVIPGVVLAILLLVPPRPSPPSTLPTSPPILRRLRL